MVAESVEPVTALYVTVWAWAESASATLAVLAIPLNTKAPPVTPETFTFVTPLALARLRVAAPVADTFSVSMAVIDVGVTEPVRTAFRTSLPAPPAKLSKVFQV